MTELVHKSRVALEKVDRWTGGSLTTVHQSFQRFLDMRGTEAAASLAYYALFSLFPLTLLLIAVLGSVLDSEVAYLRAVDFIRNVFPFSGELVRKSLSEVLERRGSIGIVGLLGALWASSGFFNTLAHSINRAWPQVKLRGLVQNRLVALGMIGVLVFLLLISLLSSTVSSFLPYLLSSVGVQSQVLQAIRWQVGLRFLQALITMLMFTALYRWVPNKTVRWRAVITGALATTILWELGKQLFSLYLTSGLVRYEFVYGSLSTLIALMVWIYVSNLMALFGAYLVATLDMRAEQAGPRKAGPKKAVRMYELHSDAGSSKGVRG